MISSEYPEKDYRRAFFGFSETVRQLCANYERPDILEIGGGKRPLFNLDSWPENIGSYTINDLDQGELDLAPDAYNKECFDICDPAPHLSESMDIVFSRFVGEHVSDGESFHRNVMNMLRKGGTAFHFVPTLYSLPFFVNWVIPERLTEQILYVASPQRKPQRKDIKAKFPAYYSWCSGTSKTIHDRIIGLGYSSVRVERFYGHQYYSNTPVLNKIEQATRNILRQSDFSILGSFAYIYAVK